MSRYSVSSTKQADGTFSAYLYCDSEAVATEVGLKNPKAVQKWAKGVAADHKTENMPSPITSESHSFTHSFTL